MSNEFQILSQHETKKNKMLKLRELRFGFWLYTTKSDLCGSFSHIF